MERKVVVRLARGQAAVEEWTQRHLVDPGLLPSDEPLSVKVTEVNKTPYLAGPGTAARYKQTSAFRVADLRALLDHFGTCTYAGTVKITCSWEARID